MIVHIDSVNTASSHGRASEGFSLALVALGVKMIRSCSAVLPQHDEKFGNEQMSDIMWRKGHWAERTKGWVVLVPVVVKTLDGIGGSPLGEKDRFPVLHHVDPPSSFCIPSRSNLFLI